MRVGGWSSELMNGESSTCKETIDTKHRTVDAMVRDAVLHVHISG